MNMRIRPYTQVELIAEAQIETTLSRMEVLRTKAQQTGVIATEAEAKAAFFFNQYTRTL